MSRRRRSRRKKHSPPDPAAVLTGRADVGLRELFELIHRVNPTGRELPAGDEARRYAQKSGLQSLLIRRFGDRLEVREDEQEGVVSLRHRSGARDACHALVDELDPDARAWVRRRLDAREAATDDCGAVLEKGSAVDRARTIEAPGDPDDEVDAEPPELLHLARREFDEYDYPAAERHLRLALEKSRGSVAAALPLLELLVGVLGMDRQALELEPRLAPEATADPGVRTSLALAAARLGDAEGALRRVAATPQAVEVYVALAALAIRERQPETARQHLDRASRHDSSHPRIPGVLQEIAELQAEVSAPAAQALEQRLLEAGALAAEDEARALLGRWPDNEVARRVLREAAALRRQAEIVQHLELAEGALDEQRFHDAAHHFQAAQAAGSARKDLPELIERAREQERRQRQQERLDAVIRDFEQGEAKAALLAYLSLPRALRGRVRERIDRPEIDWLEEIGPISSRARAQVAVAAVLAFERARRHRQSDDAEAVLDTLEPHQGVLEDAATARRWLRDARSQLASERRAKAEQMLAEARGALDTADFERAERLLERLDLDRLSRSDQARARRMIRHLHHAQERRLLEREYRRHLAADDSVGALERTYRLSQQADDDADRERWLGAAGDLRRRLCSEWLLEATTNPLPLDDLRSFYPRGMGYETPQFWLDDDGRELLLVEAWDRWLFISAVDLAASTVSDRVSLRTPEPMGRLIQNISRNGERLLIVGEWGHLLEIGRDGWQTLRWRSLRELLPEKAIIEDVQLLPDSPYLWLAFRASPTADWRSHVVDQRTWRIVRKLAGDFAQPILMSPPGFLVAPYPEGARFYTGPGRAGPEVRLAPATRVLSAAANPDGSGLWLVTINAFEEDEKHAEVLELRPGAEGPLEISGRFEITAIDPDGTQLLVALEDPGLGFLLFTNPEGDTELLAFGASNAPREPPPAADPTPTGDAMDHRLTDGLRPLYRSPVPPDTVLVQDRRARHAVALHLGEHSIAATALGPEPLSTSSQVWDKERVRDLRIPRLRPPFHCGYPTGSKGIVTEALVDEMWRSSPDAVRRRLKRSGGELFGTQVDLCHALRRHDFHDSRWPEMARELSAQQPEDPAAALLAAEAAAGDDRWDAVARRLSGVDPEGLDDGRGCHFHHLLGIAYLHLERPAEAATAFEKGLGYEVESCPLEPALELARSMLDSPEPADSGQEQSLVRQLFTAIRTADRCLEHGDVEGGLEALEQPPIRRAQELQSAARLAELYLRTPIDNRSPGAAAERFGKRLACACFLHLQGDEDIVRKELELPGMAWGKRRLEDLATRARAWLDEAAAD